MQDIEDASEKKSVAVAQICQGCHWIISVVIIDSSIKNSRIYKLRLATLFPLSFASKIVPIFLFVKRSPKHDTESVS